MLSQSEVDHTMWEIIWGYIIVFGIFVVNGGVLLVLAKSRELWKPRHLWMACLCIMDLLAGCHKSLELLHLIWPKRSLCVIYKANVGLFFVENMLLLTLLSMDRFVAVRYPFYYSSSVSNRHVMIGFIMVLLMGSSMSAASIAVGMQDPVCRAHKLQLVYMVVILSICSLLTLFFNTSVLKIAKRQLRAMYAQEVAVNPRRVSLFCHNCGYKNVALVPNYAPDLESQSPNNGVVLSSGFSKVFTEEKSILHMTVSLPPALSVPPSPKPQGSSNILCPMDLHNLYQKMEGLENTTDKATQETIPLTVSNQSGETETMSLVRTMSMPLLSSDPVTFIMPSDPIVSPAAVTLDKSTMDLMENTISEIQMISSPENNSEIIYPQQITVALPRSRSFTCATKSPSEVNMPMSHTLFRHFQMRGSQIFQMGKLFPSIRFAWTVLLIMIPMWIFILPVIIIFPFHLGCMDNGNSEYNCNVVGKLWEYLIIHVRCVLPLQAIVDTLIYACSSREFRHCFWKMVKYNPAYIITNI